MWLARCQSWVPVLGAKLNANQLVTRIDGICRAAIQGIQRPAGVRMPQQSWADPLAAQIQLSMVGLANS